MNQKLLVIKLGGSVITDKTKSVPTPNLPIIDSLAKQIATLYKTGKYKIIIAHGAGSYAHPIAKKYSLHRGMKSLEQKLGFAQITKQMSDLNLLIIQALIKHNIPAVGLSPHSFIIHSQGKLKSFDTEHIKGLLKQNIVPILHGDCVFDNQWGCSIVSGDIIVPYLASKLKADQAIFLSDVDGIFDADPKNNPQAKLIPEINNENLEQVLKGLTKNNPEDVTGEMKGKILSIKDNLKGMPVLILNGLKVSKLQQNLNEQDAGTILLFEHKAP